MPASGGNGNGKNYKEARKAGDRTATGTARIIRKPGRQEREHGNDGNGKNYEEARKA